MRTIHHPHRGANMDFHRLTQLTIVLATFLEFIVHGEVTKPKHKVLLVSMDGFRHDYFSKTSTPHFGKMMLEGVRVPYVNNSFITNTFPSHYTMVTGLYTESHGIINNRMYDPLFDAKFRPGNTEARWWCGGEPIWTTAEKAGLKSGVFYWPGSDTENQGIRPTFWFPYKDATMFEIRVWDTVNWLATDQIDLGVIYFHQPDRTGHDFGPDTPEMVIAIKRMDDIVGYIFEQLDKAGIKDKTNVIITSDHGMAPVNVSTSAIDLYKYVNSSLLRLLVDQGSTAHMWTQPGKAKDLRDALQGVQHLKVYLKEDIPERYHMKNHRRVPDVFAVADLGWVVTDDYANRLDDADKGDHGYDNELDIMKPILLAQGPDFKRGEIVEPIENVDIYPLVCHLLGIEPAPNNGSLQRASGLLGNSTSNSGLCNKRSIEIWALILMFYVLWL